MTEHHYDIVIIGAGLCGLAAASAIARTGGLKVALIEGVGIGSNGPSPLTFAETVEHYDLADCLKSKLSGFVFHNYHGSTIHYSFNGTPLVVLDYKKACDKIFSKVRQGHSPAVFLNAFAADCSCNKDGIVLTLRDNHKLVTSFLIDCSGKAQFMAGKLQKQNPRKFYSHVYGGFFEKTKNQDDSAGYFLWPCREFGSGGGWFYPAENRTASFGYATITETPQSDLRVLEDKFKKAVEVFEPYASYLKGAELAHVECGVIPITYEAEFVHDRIIIAGDAAGMATNWTCMGVEPALKYGTLAGELASKAASVKDPGVLKEYQRQWERENKIRYDSVASQAETFWKPDYYLWEWIIKNDLAFLSPEQLLGRMQNNDHLLKKHEIMARALRYKVLSLIRKDAGKPRMIVIR